MIKDFMVHDMLKIFLVEDEVVIRNGIKNNIPWEREGFIFAGEASDGELAYPLIMKEKPDILITDIKMPFMDGLELSRLVRKELPQIRIIILSGYNEFDYAKSAIDIGVTQYLLKPISSAKLLEEVKAVAAKIEKEREQDRMLEQYRKEMRENLLLERQKLWNALIANELSTAELFESGRKLGLDFTAPAYQVLLFKLMPGEDPVGSLREPPQTAVRGIAAGQEDTDTPRALIAVSDRIVELSESWEQVLSFDRSPEGWIFLIKGETEFDVEARLAQCVEQLQTLAAEYPEIEYFGGIGMAVQRFRDIRTSYQEAGKAFAGRFFTEPNQVIRSEDVARLHQSGGERIDLSGMRSRRDERERVDRFLKNGTLEEVDNFLEEYFIGVGEQNLQSMLYRQYVVMDLYFSVADFLGNLEMGTEELPPACRDINEIVADSTSVQETKRRIGGLFTEAMKLRDSSSMKRCSAVLEEARAFIRENYQREDMSLNTVASQVNISPSYFSAIFSAQTGQTFVEYLTSVRLEKAKELLMCTSMRTAEIGYEVGYKDSHYFSYIFRKVVGCSPTEYKNRRTDGAKGSQS